MEASSATPTISLKSTGRSRRRRRANRVAEGVAVLAALLAIGVLALVVISVFVRGVKALNLDFFTKSQVTFGETGGGIANGLVGTAIMVQSPPQSRCLSGSSSPCTSLSLVGIASRV